MRKIIFGIIFLLAMASVYAETISYDDFECNGFGCGSGWNNNWTITGAVEMTTLSSPQGTYMMRAVNGGTATRIFDNSEYTATTISFWATATSLEAGDYCRYFYYNGTGYVQLLQLADGQDTGTLQYYSYNVTPVNANAGIRMQAVASTGDYCYIDTITTAGNISMPSLYIYMDTQYPIGKTNVKIDLTSTQTNTNYILTLYDGSNNVFCTKNVTSPSVAQTTFSTYCNMPATIQTNARAVISQVGTPANNQTKYFNIVNYQQDTGKLSIQQVYFSAQVLQGGQTEIFAIINKDPSVTITKLYTELTFPDNTTRILSMDPTINEGEYRAFITDTYRTGTTTFKVRVEGGVYYDEYTNQYIVAGYNVDFVDVVNKVAEVAVCKKVEEVPEYSVDLSGTEYSPGDRATMFLQLKDNYGQPVSNGSCWLDVWWPANTSNIHPYTIQDAPMIKALGDDGVYYYDMIAPDELGVYMLSAKCSYALNRYEIYAQDDLVNYPIVGINSGTFTGNPLVLNTPHDRLYYKCDGICQANFTFNTSIYGTLSNVTAINNYLYVSTQSAETITIAYWNGTAFVNLPNTLSTVTTASGSTPYGYDQVLSNSVPTSAIIGNKVILRITGTSGTYFFNSFGIDVLTSNGQIQDLKGSSEMHITNIPNATVTLVNNQTPGYVWNYTTRNLTYYEDVTNYTRINDSIVVSANNVINNLTTQITYLNNNLISINGTLYQKIDAINSSINANIDYTRTNITDSMANYYTSIINTITNIPLSVWSYATRNLTYYEHVDMTNYSWINQTMLGYYTSIINTITNVPLGVWTYTTRNLTYYPPVSNLTAQDVWDYTNRNLTYYQNFTEPQQDLTNYTLINDGVSAAVWVYSTRNLTYYENFTEPQIDMTNYSRISNLTATDVWEYNNRNLTYYPAQIDLTNYTLISEGVWTWNDRNLTYYAPAFVNTTEVAIAVWDYDTRNLTYYPLQVDLTNYTAINEGVWTYTDRNLTYYPAQLDLTNYSLIESGVWAYTNRTLTFYPTQVDLTNYTLINEGVWAYSDRNLTYYPPVSNLTAADVWTYSDRNLTYYQVNNITAQDVWEYINRTLTYYEVNNITATDVWTYNDRNLTFYPSQQDLTNYSAIWTYPDRNLTYYAPASVNNTAVAQETWQYPARYTHGELITG